MTISNGTTPHEVFGMQQFGPIFLSRAVATRLVFAWVIVAAFRNLLHSLLGPDMSLMVALSCFVLLFGTVLVAAFGAVHEADELAHRLGEPYGTLILTVSIVAIEVTLIAAVMLGPSESATIGRDSIFAVMMIVMNLVTGLCLLAGAFRYGEQEYNAPGAVSFISMILVLVGITFLLPTASGSADGSHEPVQAISVAVLIFLCYAGFLALQMGRYRSDFMQPETGTMHILLRKARRCEAAADVDSSTSGERNLKHAMTLVGFILPVVLLAHDLAVTIDYGVARAEVPAALSGILIAVIVFTPESVAALKAALNNQAQRAINLCLGAFVSTVGLTVPAVLVVGLIAGRPVVFGISKVETVLIALTVGLTTLTYMGHRTSASQGLLHLMLFAVFILMLLTA